MKAASTARHRIRWPARATWRSQTLIQLQQQLSNEQDADAAQASLDLTQATTDQQAAMASQAMLKPQSLFNYLG